MRNGAQIMLMTVDDDFDGTPWFPPFHASDGVFRAVENRVAFGLGMINSLSLVVDPFGRIMGHFSNTPVIVAPSYPPALGDEHHA